MYFHYLDVLFVVARFLRTTMYEYTREHILGNDLMSATTVAVRLLANLS